MKIYSLYYEGPYYMLGAFSAHAVEIEAILYPTAEHAYQALKFIKSAPHVHQMIIEARSPLEAKKIKDTYIAQLDPSFEARKVEVMKEIFLEKAKQHPEVREALRNSGTSIIGEQSPTDEFWGIGKNLDGENMLGKIWMEIRDFLQE